MERGKILHNIRKFLYTKTSEILLILKGGGFSCEVLILMKADSSYFGGITQTVTPDNCKVAVTENRDWIDPALNRDFQAWA